jgi:assimilatory nitrate reductase catalytic subunit
MNAHVHPPAVRTTCPYCGVGCGILAMPDGKGGAAVSGDPEHPANFGRLCSKGAALGETLGLETRVLHPMVRENGAQGSEFLRTDWDTALDKVADGFKRIVERDGPDAVAFYLSGQLLTEDYYVANKLMKGFIGSAHVDTNSRLCMASSVAGHKRAFGSDTVPGLYEDFDLADLIVLVGSNAAWCHPVLFQRMLENRQKRGAKIVVIDPRRTATADEADLHLAIKPGMDTALFCGLLAYLAHGGALDQSYIERHTTGFASSLARAREIAPDLDAVARSTGLLAADVRRFYELFAATPRVVSAWSQGVNQSAQGTDKVGTIINCHLATGRIGRRGMGPFSLTGQPNAMGGREVGGLANQLAAHMNFSALEIDRVRRFWNAPNIATHEGLKAVQMFEAIESGQIKALWVMATNPAVTLPRAGAMRDALKNLELFVVSENVASNDTVNAGAHILLPAAAWGEKDGTVTNSERRVSRQRGFISLPGEARPDWWIVTQVARRMGFADAFAYETAADVFREHAALSAFENDGARDFDLGALAAVEDQAFDALEPIMWPLPERGCAQDKRFFADGGYFTPDRKARFIAPETPALRSAATGAYPFVLNTGRVRDQWHTMTRTGLSPRLGLHSPEPFVEVHPDDALSLGLGEFARVRTRHGEGIFKVSPNEGQQRGSLFVPFHWSAETASSVRTCELVAPHTDPFSGQPEAKGTPAAVSPVDYAYRGFLLTRTRAELPAEAWWSRVTTDGGPAYLIATDIEPKLWRARFDALTENAEIAEFIDTTRNIYRAAAFRESHLENVLFLGPSGAAPQWQAIKVLFAAMALTDVERRVVLSGRAADGLAEIGPVICACFGVGLTAIREAIVSKRATNVDAIGKALRAGTNCGSCLPELKRIVHDHAHAR